jgi:hypothetical protein
MGAQNTQIWTARLRIAIKLTSAQNGGYCPADDGLSPPQSVTCRADEF